MKRSPLVLFALACALLGALVVAYAAAHPWMIAPSVRDGVIGGAP